MKELEALENLLENALKFTSEGVVSVDVARKRKQEEEQDHQEEAIVTIEDTGTGITYSSNESNPMDMLAYVRDLANDEAFCITDKPGWYTLGYWSPDSTKFSTCYAYRLYYLVT